MREVYLPIGPNPGLPNAMNVHYVLYSGREDGLHHEGVANIMKKEMEKYLMEWKPVNSRIIQPRLKDRQTNLSIIQCCAPTNEKKKKT